MKEGSLFVYFICRVEISQIITSLVTLLVLVETSSNEMNRGALI
jgi:hypothetical protein